MEPAVTASSHTLHALLSAPCVVFIPLFRGTRRGRDNCASFTDSATEAHGGVTSNPSPIAGESRAGI